MRLGGLNLLIKYVLVMVVVGTTSTSVRIPNLQRGIRVPRSLTLKGASPKEGRPKPKKGNGVDVHPRWSVPCVNILIVKSADRTLKPAFVAGKAGTWSIIAHRTGVRLEVMLMIGLIN